MADPQEYGHLTVEDDPAGTVDAGQLAGTTESDDATVGYEPESTDTDDGRS
jgi:hypothetical protein